MSDRQLRREPTVGDTERPMYESLPHRRFDTDDDTPWTLTNKITLSVIVMMASIGRLALLRALGD